GVDGGGRRIEGGEVLGEAPVAEIARAAEKVERRRGGAPVEEERREADAAIADHDRRHALARLPRHRRLGEERAVVMRMDVDEAGRQGLSAEVDLLSPGAFGDVPDEGDASRLDGKGAGAAGGAGAVDERC